MKRLIIIPAYTLLLITISFFSCNKPPDIRFTDTPINKTPAANAGPDQTISLPTDSVVLDGTGSMDPDGKIVSYQWTKISGPPSCAIRNYTSAQATVTGLIQGSYMFSLNVTDEKGLDNSDMIEVFVRPATSFGCNGVTRPLINVSFTETGTLSEPRVPYVCAAGNKVVFAGGSYIDGPYYDVSAAVDIFDINSKTWTTATLSEKREGIGTVSCGTRIFFAGGGYWDMAVTNIDIYDVSTNIWSRMDLSVARSYLTAATVANKVFFAGGFTCDRQPSPVVEIYDLTTNTWSSHELIEPRYNLSSVTAGDKIYFAGGIGQNGSSNQVDIYNSTTNTWSTSNLQQLSGMITGVVSGNKIYWAGTDLGQIAGKVEIWNTADGSITFDCLTYPRQAPAAAINDDDVVFFTSLDWNNEIDLMGNLRKEIDIYNVTAAQWSVGQLPERVIAPAVITWGNSLYMAGGRTGPQTCSDKIYILNW